MADKTKQPGRGIAARRQRRRLRIIKICLAGAVVGGFVFAELGYAPENAPFKQLYAIFLIVSIMALLILSMNGSVGSRDEFIENLHRESGGVVAAKSTGDLEQYASLDFIRSPVARRYIKRLAYKYKFYLSGKIHGRLWISLYSGAGRFHHGCLATQLHCTPTLGFRVSRHSEMYSSEMPCALNSVGISGIARSVGANDRETFLGILPRIERGLVPLHRRFEVLLLDGVLILPHSGKPWIHSYKQLRIASRLAGRLERELCESSKSKNAVTGDSIDSPASGPKPDFPHIGPGASPAQP
ncbi:MAG: hypothetical protein NXI24_10565 [bacterium]|nr:hypothetical protein [bacterium]